MSCIIFGYRRFYAIICKITHFFYPKRKNPPLFAHSATALSFKNSSPCQKQHYFIARIQAVFSLVLHFSLLVLTD